MMKNVPEKLFIILTDYTQSVGDFKRLKPHEVAVSSTKKIADDDIEYIRADIANAAVAAERRRVWNFLVNLRRFYLVEQINISPDEALSIAIKELFPDGEPNK